MCNNVEVISVKKQDAVLALIFYEAMLFAWHLTFSTIMSLRYGHMIQDAIDLSAVTAKPPAPAMTPSKASLPPSPMHPMTSAMSLGAPSSSSAGPRSPYTGPLSAHAATAALQLTNADPNGAMSTPQKGGETLSV